MTRHPLTLERVGPDQIAIRRTFDASAERVFRAFTVPDRVMQWMGTPRAPMSRCEIDLRVGGTLRYEWGEMGMTGTFREIDPPHRLVHTEIFDEDWTGGETEVITTFIEDSGRTTVQMLIRYGTEAARDRVLNSPMEEGMATGYDKLDELLVRIDPRLDLVLERWVPVSPSKVWRAWTEPELLVQWFTPKPWTTASAQLDVRPGGLFRTVMRSPEGEEHGSDGCYLEVVHERKLVWTDALGPGYRPNQEAFMTGILLLEPEGDGTRYIAIVRHASREAVEQHEGMGFYQGWGTALDQLVALMS